MKNLIIGLLAIVVSAESYFLFFAPPRKAIEQYKIPIPYAQSLIKNFQETAQFKDSTVDLTQNIFFPKVLLDALNHDLKKLPGKNSDKGFRIYLAKYGTVGADGKEIPELEGKLTVVLKASSKVRDIPINGQQAIPPAQNGVYAYNYGELCPRMCDDGDELSY